MKVRAIFESNRTRVVLEAETEAEMKMLGVLGTELAAEVSFRHEGHASYGKVASVSVELQPRSLRDPEAA